MVLDRVLTVAIGRNTQNGTPLTDAQWNRFQARVNSAIARKGIVVAHAVGEAVGSDGENEGQDEDTAVIVCINPKEVGRLRTSVARIISEYGQGSAAFAYDEQHEPVFATSDGTREAAKIVKELSKV